MVERAIFQVRRVVNRIIDEYGKPTTIRIEMAHMKSNNALQRSDIKKNQGANEQANNEAREFLTEELGLLHPNRDDLIKYRLWLECNKECPFTGNVISAHELFIQPGLPS